MSENWFNERCQIDLWCTVAKIWVAFQLTKINKVKRSYKQVEWDKEEEQRSLEKNFVNKAGISQNFSINSLSETWCVKRQPVRQRFRIKVIVDGVRTWKVKNDEFRIVLTAKDIVASTGRWKGDKVLKALKYLGRLEKSIECCARYNWKMAKCQGSGRRDLFYMTGRHWTTNYSPWWV